MWLSATHVSICDHPCVDLRPMCGTVAKGIPLQMMMAVAIDHVGTVLFTMVQQNLHVSLMT